MKKNYFLVTVLLLMFSASFTSCDSEPVDTQLVDTENTPGPGNNNGNDDSGSDTTGSYWPMAVNNKWIYDTGSEPYEMKIIGTETINGTVYYKYNDFMGDMSAMPAGSSGSSTTYTRKNNSDYIARATFSVQMPPGLPQMTLSPIEYVMLKDNLAVGQSWTQNVDQIMSITVPGFDEMQQITNTLTFKGTIMEKSETAVLDGVTYNDVIKVKFEQIMMGNTAAATYFWFVKNKGMMKAITESEDSDEEIHYKIDSYVIN